MFLAWQVEQPMHAIVDYCPAQLTALGFGRDIRFSPAPEPDVWSPSRYFDYALLTLLIPRVWLARGRVGFAGLERLLQPLLLLQSPHVTLFPGVGASSVIASHRDGGCSLGSGTDVEGPSHGGSFEQSNAWLKKFTTTPAAVQPEQRHFLAEQRSVRVIVC